MVNEHRCFLAIDIEPNLVQKIEEVQKEFKKTNNNVKYVKTENLHFTLKFFGNVSDTKINEIKKAIDKVLSNVSNNDDKDENNSKTELIIKGIGTFPNKNYMKVLWIGTQNNSFLLNLQKELDSEFTKLGFKKEKNFKTHLTIGRIRNLKDKNEFKEKIDELKNISIGTMNISKISLKKSELTPKGPIYSDIEIFEI
ncbi:RNA 2',3'-cyclic phosphodiesterase [Methanobrevibacter sp. TMH8]|uniref:RNA 2',3'-cyclic phosphodiesterase n=1 Tax=Methanobrevibacter sp. TMH8 TaxID=2848611 RepID=UPI001CD02EAD|nr:RNA 2',3'-cyclic phosphodiesterase [Methanobrevibacter sp. TMH8]MBZ9571502.1 RNA 2',3'-cyclic phosphodiesterase [Methanobrevibacter sp. TMH8]